MEEPIIVGILVGLTLWVVAEIVATFKAKRKDITKNSENNIKMSSNITYIKEKIDDMKDFPNRLTIVELSDNEAHRKINKNIIEIEKIKDERRNNNNG